MDYYTSKIKNIWQKPKKTKLYFSWLLSIYTSQNIARCKSFLALSQSQHFWIMGYWSYKVLKLLLKIDGGGDPIFFLNDLSMSYNRLDQSFQSLSLILNGHLTLLLNAKSMTQLFWPALKMKAQNLSQESVKLVLLIVK